MSFSKSQSPILYQNDDCSIILIDIPRSIADAQGTPECPVSDTLLSYPPLEYPFKIDNEPKTSKGIEQMQGNTFEVELHDTYRRYIDEALHVIRNNITAKWCLPRKYSTRAVPQAETMESQPSTAMETDLSHSNHSNTLLSSHGKPGFQHKGKAPVEALLSTLCSFSSGQMHGFPPTMEFCAPTHGSRRAASPARQEEPWISPIYNERRIPMTLIVRHNMNTEAVTSTEFRFKIPPLAKIMLANFDQTYDFHDALQTLAQQYDLTRHFNFILLDPPWPNRSAKRKHSYSIEPTLGQVKQLLSKLDLKKLIARDGVIAVWITNKAAVRRMVLGPDGLFERLNLTLIEEWIWIKTTMKGEPIFDLDSMLRKPYEVLLLGQPLERLPGPQTEPPPAKVRVIAGVPDQHSRKPCLKRIIEQLLPTASGYAAMEVFARHLVSGWWSWGNEVLKYNLDGHWASASNVDISPT